MKRIFCDVENAAFDDGEFVKLPHMTVHITGDKTAHTTKGRKVMLRDEKWVLARSRAFEPLLLKRLRWWRR